MVRGENRPDVVLWWHFIFQCSDRGLAGCAAGLVRCVLICVPTPGLKPNLCCVVSASEGGGGSVQHHVITSAAKRDHHTPAEGALWRRQL